MLNEYLRKQEIIAVKELGEVIGYGNLMDIASALWTMKLSADGETRIMHIPTVKPCVKDEEWKEIEECVLGRVEEIKSYGINFETN